MSSLTFPKNHYELLGVSSSADSVALRRAFCSLSKTLHPDTTLLPAEEAAFRFQQVCEAYELLIDAKLRKAYDQSLLLEANKEKLLPTYQAEDQNNPFLGQVRGKEVRRSLSGGELFSLLLLGIALLFSLILGIGFAFSQGRELQVRPSWLMVEESLGNESSTRFRDVTSPPSANTIESTFISSS